MQNGGWLSVESYDDALNRLDRRHHDQAVSAGVSGAALHRDGRHGAAADLPDLSLTALDRFPLSGPLAGRRAPEQAEIGQVVQHRYHEVRRDAGNAGTGGEVGHPRRGRPAANPLREAEQEGSAVEDGFGNKFIRARLAKKIAITREDAAVSQHSSADRQAASCEHGGEMARRHFGPSGGDHRSRHAVHGIGDGGVRVAAAATVGTTPRRTGPIRTTAAAAMTAERMGGHGASFGAPMPPRGQDEEGLCCWRVRRCRTAR